MGWTTKLTEPERRRLVEETGTSHALGDEMKSANAHKLYCADIQSKAQDELVLLPKKRVDIERRMENSQKLAEQEDRAKKETLAVATQNNQGNMDEDNDRAKDLEEKAKSMDLGQNLEARNLDRKAPVPKVTKEKVLPTVGGAQEEPFDLDGGEDDRGHRDKKDKKDKRDKKDKHDKKDKK